MSRIMVTLVTGFLGSGKTTLLNSILHHPDMSEAAVIVNEFGEIGIDYDLVERSDETIVQLENGCLCCSVKGDLIDTFRDLYIQRQSGILPKFSRVIIETTGIANPGPLLQIILTDPLVNTCYELDGIVTTVDAINGYASLENFPECVKQVAVADRIVLTKTDLIKTGEDEKNLEKTKHRIRKINPNSNIIEAVLGSLNIDELFGFGLEDLKSKRVDLNSWLQLAPLGDISSDDSEQEDSRDEKSQAFSKAYYAKFGHNPNPENDNPHDTNIKSFCIVRDEPLSLDTLRLFLDALTREAGEDLLRVKGIVNIKERPKHPAIIQGAQKIFHSIEWLEKWPSEDKQTRIVFITRGFSQQHIEDTFSLIERMAQRVS